MGLKQKAAIFAVALITLASALGAATIVGREARAVELIALFAGGFGAGASLVTALAAIRAARVNTAPAQEAEERRKLPGEG